MRRLIAVFGLAALCLGQSGPDISAYYRLNPSDAPLYRWLHLPAGSITVDPNGDPRFILPVVPAIVPGRGLISVTTGGTAEFSIDTSQVPYRVPMPAGQGPCTDPISGLPLGSNAYAADSTGRADCVADPANPGSFVWMKTAGSTTF